MISILRIVHGFLRLNALTTSLLRFVIGLLLLLEGGASLVELRHKASQLHSVDVSCPAIAKWNYQTTQLLNRPSQRLSRRPKLLAQLDGQALEVQVVTSGFGKLLADGVALGFGGFGTLPVVKLHCHGVVQ